MKKIILILAMAAFLVSCQKPETTSPTISQAIEENTQTTSQITGKLLDRYIENDIKYMEVEGENEKIKIDASNYKDFETLEVGSLYKISYDHNSQKLQYIERLEGAFSEENMASESNEEASKKPESKQVPFTENINLEGLNLYNTIGFAGFDSFNILSVDVYTDAEKDENGDFLFDDGNRFLVVAKEENGGYILFDERIQLGGIKVNAYTIDEVLKISLLETSTASISFKTFEKIDDAFIETIRYEGQGNINMLGSI